MIRYLCNKMLLSTQERYAYDVGYLQDILETDLSAFTKFIVFQPMASHQGNLPATPLFAARLRATLWEDCGSCIQFVVNLALEAGVSPDTVQAILENHVDTLPEDVALAVDFTESVLAHAHRADELRADALKRWGREGLVSLSFAIGSSRVYPALKYSLGYGGACRRVQVQQHSLVPQRSPLSKKEGTSA